MSSLAARCAIHRTYGLLVSTPLFFTLETAGKRGQKWTLGIKKVLPFYDVDFCDDQNGVICGQGLMLYTEDGGASWHTGNLRTSIQYLWLHDVSCTTDAVWMVGQHGTIFKSDTGVKEWEESVY